MFSPLGLSHSKKHSGGCRELRSLLLLIDGSLGLLWELCWKGKTRIPGSGRAQGDFWEVIVGDFTEELWIQTFRRSRSTVDGYSDGIGPCDLVAPSTPGPGEPVPLDNHVTCKYKIKSSH